MTYKDTADGRLYRAFVILVSLDDPAAPPVCVSPVELWKEDRFQEVTETHVR